MAGDRSWCVPLPGTQGDAWEHSTGTALQPGLQAGLKPTQEKQILWDSGSGTRPGKPHIWVCWGVRAQHSHGRAQLVRGQPFPGCRAGRMSRTVWEGSFYK